MKEQSKVVKKPVDEQQEISMPIEKVIEKQSVIEGIFEQTESLTKKQVSNKKRHRGEIIELVGGGKLSLSVLASLPQKHPSQFTLEYYTPVFRILNLDGDPSEWNKPKEVADFTNEVIYGRYEKDVLPTIRLHNKYIGYCIREHKNYKFLNEKGLFMLQTFIHEAIDTLSECDTYYQFRIKMFEKYKLPYQIEIF